MSGCTIMYLPRRLKSTYFFIIPLVSSGPLRAKKHWFYPLRQTVHCSAKMDFFQRFSSLWYVAGTPVEEGPHQPDVRIRGPVYTGDFIALFIHCNEAMKITKSLQWKQWKQWNYKRRKLIILRENFSKNDPPLEFYYIFDA